MFIATTLFAASVTKSIKVTELNVKGMTCTSCAAKIKKRLGKFEGVKATVVDVDAGTVRVEFDESKVKLEDMTAALGRLGYTVEN